MDEGSDPKKIMNGREAAAQADMFSSTVLHGRMRCGQVQEYMIQSEVSAPSSLVLRLFCSSISLNAPWRRAVASQSFVCFCRSRRIIGFIPWSITSVPFLLRVFTLSVILPRPPPVPRLSQW